MFFGKMSIFSQVSSIQALNYLAHGALASDCLLCGSLGEGEICLACDASFERVAHACPRCALPLPESHRCGACLAHPPAFDAAIALFAYRFPLERLMHRFKYGGDLACGKWLASQLASRVAHEAPPQLLVVPPAARERLHRRGFNPAAEIAKVVAHRTRARFERHLVRRVREQAPQAGLPRRERLANLRGVFVAGTNLDGRHVVVVDDVMTTGATAEAMARALKDAGAASVRIWVVARTPEPGG
jgi:ComF family protein